MKIKPFEKYLGDDPVVSYIGIRADENREGYISQKPTITAVPLLLRMTLSKKMFSSSLKPLWVYLNTISGARDRVVIFVFSNVKMSDSTQAESP
jgi:hypothetical protein